MIYSRSYEDVYSWLKSNGKSVKLVSRDGSNIYKSAITNALPKAVQITDRFHLIKGLTEYATKEIKRIIPRISVVSIKNIKNNPNYVKTTVKKAKSKQTDKMKQRLKLINEIIKRYKECNSIRQVAREFKMSKATVANYIKGFIPDLSNKRSKPLENYKHEIIEMINNNSKITEIHNFLITRGIKTNYSNTRSYVSKLISIKPKTKQSKLITEITTTNVFRSEILKLLYNRGIADLKLMKSEKQAIIQFLKENKSVQKIINLVVEFRVILASKNINKLNVWLNDITEDKYKYLTSFKNSTLKDIEAVYNAINLDYSNGKIEGKINKLKKIKRDMYGRCSFELLRAKFFLAEHQPN